MHTAVGVELVSLVLGLLISKTSQPSSFRDPPVSASPELIRVSTNMPRFLLSERTEI